MVNLPSITLKNTDFEAMLCNDVIIFFIQTFRITYWDLLELIDDQESYFEPKSKKGLFWGVPPNINGARVGNGAIAIDRGMCGVQQCIYRRVIIRFSIGIN